MRPAQEMVHRDAKPANILIFKDGHTYLCDFGIAHFAESSMLTTGMASEQGSASSEQKEAGAIRAVSDPLACVPNA